MSSTLSTKIILYSIILLFFIMMEIGYVWDNRTEPSILDQTTSPTTTEELQPETLIVAIQTCPEETKCLNSTSLSIQHTNCTIFPEPCLEGCFNDSCLAVVCSEKFQCQNSTTRAFQSKDCS